MHTWASRNLSCRRERAWAAGQSRPHRPHTADHHRHLLAKPQVHNPCAAARDRRVRPREFHAPNVVERPHILHFHKSWESSGSLPGAACLGEHC